MCNVEVVAHSDESTENYDTTNSLSSTEHLSAHCFGFTVTTLLFWCNLTTLINLFSAKKILTNCTLSVQHQTPDRHSERLAEKKQIFHAHSPSKCHFLTYLRWYLAKETIVLVLCSQVFGYLSLSYLPAPL